MEKHVKHIMEFLPEEIEEINKKHEEDLIIYMLKHLDLTSDILNRVLNDLRDNKAKVVILRQARNAMLNLEKLTRQFRKVSMRIQEKTQESRSPKSTV